MQDFRKLKVWGKAHRLTLDAYRVSATLPAEERFGLAAQIRRSAASIPSNIAEGCGRGGRKEFARFLRVSLGSASELEYHVLLARDLGFLNDGEHRPLTEAAVEVKRMSASLIQRLSAKPSRD